MRRMILIVLPLISALALSITAQAQEIHYEPFYLVEPADGTPIDTVVVSANGERTAMISDDYKQVEIIDVQTGDRLGSISRVYGNVYFALSPQGNYFAFPANNEIHVWDIEASQTTIIPMRESAVDFDFGFLGEEKLWINSVTPEMTYLEIWNIGEISPMTLIEGINGVLASSPDGERAVVADSRSGRILLVDLINGDAAPVEINPASEMIDPDGLVFAERIQRIVFTRPDEIVYLLSSIQTFTSGLVKLEIVTKEPEILLDLGNAPIIYNTSEALMLDTGSAIQTVDFGSGNVIGSISDIPLAISDDGKTAAIQAQDKFFILDVATGNEVPVLFNDCDACAWNLNAADGYVLIWNENSVGIWRLVEGE